MEEIAIYGNPKQNDYIGRIEVFLKALTDRGMRLWVYKEFSDYLRAFGVSCDWTPTRRLPREAERLVSIGGDGTFLRAAKWAGKSGVPILGINTGHLGFLASYSFRETEELVEVLCSGDGRVEKRMLLKVESPDMPANFYPYALNEVAILKSDSASMVNVRTWVNDCYLADYLADGLLVATPTGSTAYNLSAGGPILEPTVSNMVLSPVAPHSLTMRPLVIGGDVEVKASVSCGARRCRVSLDGRTFMLSCGEEYDHGSPSLRITSAAYTVNILHRPDYHFADILRNKLLWGAAIRK